MGDETKKDARSRGSVLNALLSCPDCGGIVKDQIYTSGYAIHGNFYCVMKCGFNPVRFHGDKEHHACRSRFKREPVQDDFIFVYKRGEEFRVFGLGDATFFKSELEKDGFVLSQTLSASVVFENLLNCNQKGRIDLVSDLRR